MEVWRQFNYNLEELEKLYLLDETQLLSLALIQPRLDRVGLFQPLQREDEQFGVVLVGEWRERNRGEPS